MVASKKGSIPPASDPALQVAGSWLQALTDGSREAVALFDGERRVQYLSMSGAVEALIGYDALALMRMGPNDLLHPLDIERVVDAFRNVSLHPGTRINIEYRARHRAGHYVRLQSTAVNRLNNKHVNAIVAHTREARSAEPVAARSGPEPTPQLDDDERLLEEITEAIEKASCSQYTYSLVVLELERGHALVEAYGEEVAVAVQAEVARRLHALLRPGDHLAKLKSGEFAILLDGVGDRALAERIAVRIQETVGSRYSVKGQDIYSSTIVGIVTNERRYEHPGDVLRDALLAAAKAKGEGPDSRVVFRTQLRVDKTRHMSLMAELHHALGRGQLRVHYLPVIALPTRTLSGFEALVRWQHPKRGLISPELFIPLAVETGMIVQLGRWVLLQACQQMADWSIRYPMDPPLVVHVNLAGRQFEDGDVHAQLATILEDTRLDGRQLVLDLSEPTVVEYRDAVDVAVPRFKKMGVKVAADRFGEGAASFTQLHQIPYDQLKVHRSLVAQVGEGGRARDVVQAAVDLAHNLSMEVVAVGVETPAQAAQMGRLNCEYAEGYLFGEPVDGDAAGALIASYPKWWA
ncbi:MAG: EAL domain-containing protein [Deltaproteobacteria bacterium]|nr:EAL domain-containing protein [Deltaproteobacteria bacterium]